ncbi:MAG: hypothetical protein U9Q08_04540 [Candidatus Omnitrophota bacterium]|nr:hypothetical protein [Candidatus Omnitrophota bacterium]
MKKLFVVLIGILVVIVALSFTKDLIIKASIEKGVETITGLRLSMQGLRVGIINTFLRVKGLELFNPKGYKDRIMLDMPEIYVDYDLPAIIKGKIHLKEMRMNLREFTVIKNEAGELNLNSLKVVQAEKEGKRAQVKKAQVKEKGKVPEIQIDSLELKIGKVVYKDYSKGKIPSVKEFNINLNERYENVTDPYSLVSLIVVRALTNVAIAGLIDFDLQSLQGTISGVLATTQKATVEVMEKTQEIIKGTTQKTQEVAGQTTQKAQEIVEETAQTLQKATEGLTDTLKLPFNLEKE